MWMAGQANASTQFILTMAMPVERTSSYWCLRKIITHIQWYALNIIRLWIENRFYSMIDFKGIIEYNFHFICLHLAKFAYSLENFVYIFHEINVWKIKHVCIENLSYPLHWSTFIAMRNWYLRIYGHILEGTKIRKYSKIRQKEELNTFACQTYIANGHLNLRWILFILRAYIYNAHECNTWIKWNKLNSNGINKNKKDTVCSKIEEKKKN